MSEIVVPDQDEIVARTPWLSRPTQSNRSRWTGRRKVIGLPGAEVWQGNVQLSDVATEAAERKWRAFLYALRGSQNWFRYILPCNTHSGAMPTVRTGASIGYTLPLEGMAANQTVLEVGQFLTVPMPSGHFRTVCLMADLQTNGLGESTAVFEPALNEIPVVGAQVETRDPFIPMASKSPDLPMEQANGVSGFAFDVEEAM